MERKLDINRKHKMKKTKDEDKCSSLKTRNIFGISVLGFNNFSLMGEGVSDFNF